MRVFKEPLYLISCQMLSFIILYLIRIYEKSTENLVTQITIASLIAAYIPISYYLIRYKKIPYPNQYYKYLSSFLLSFILLSWSVINIERSRSFQVLRSIHVNEISNQSKLSQLPILTYDQKERNYRAILSRIKEQVNDGNARCEDNTIYLTTIGNLIQNMSAEIATLYKLEGYFEIDVLGEKTPLSPTKIDCGYFE